jgi:hypothetical protein
MAVLIRHLPLFTEVFSLAGFLTDPVLSFGFHPAPSGIIHVRGVLCRDLADMLRALGLKEVATLDLFDDRADLKLDMNEPVPESQHERYATLIDIGSVEHVFDTRQCLENCMRMVRPGGHYFIHTPVNGFFGHGLHVFNPETLHGALAVNGFDVIYTKFSTFQGEVIEDPSVPGDVLAWIVGRKTRSIEKFVCPQQGGWRNVYARSVEDGANSSCLGCR